MCIIALTNTLVNQRVIGNQCKQIGSIDPMGYEPNHAVRRAWYQEGIERNPAGLVVEHRLGVVVELQQVAVDWH